MRFYALALALACAAALASDGQDDSWRERVERSVGADRFGAGGTALVSSSVAGDLFLAGGEVIVGDEVGGDLVAAGGTIRIDADSGQDVYAAGGQLSLNARVARNARLAGGKLDIGPRARIAGSLAAAGGRINVRGPVDGYVLAAAKRVYIDAPIGGDVELRASSIELGPRARIAGGLRYAAQTELQRDPAAEIGGSVERIEPRRAADWLRIGDAVEGAIVAAFWIWTVGMMVLAVVFVVVAPKSATQLAETVRGRFWTSLLVGFLTLVAAPIAIAILLATGIGAPLGLLLLLAYAAVLLVGYAAAGVALGQGVLERINPDRTRHRAWQAAAAVLALLVLTLLALIPVLGGLIAFVALLVGAGALLFRAGTGARPKADH
ncbi:MAG: polymer-forming cytoskeletal protein [Burkholderiales bacterium]|nr:polymer-forming cytoskeletal protein [Burkholderiales bacterium]